MVKLCWTPEATRGTVTCVCETMSTAQQDSDEQLANLLADYYGVELEAEAAAPAPEPDVTDLPPARSRRDSTGDTFSLAKISASVVNMVGAENVKSLKAAIVRRDGVGAPVTL